MPALASYFLASDCRDRPQGRAGCGDISAALARWRKARAVHDPGKILLDVPLTVALGADCPANVAILRAEPAAFGLVASDPTVSHARCTGSQAAHHASSAAS